MTVVIALDVGGTSIKSGLVRPDGTSYHTERHASRAERGPAAVVDTIAAIADGLADRARADGLTPVAVGIAVPGVVDDTTGTAVWSANLGFRDVPLRDLIATRLALPTALGHDVRVGGLAEARLGAARGSRHVLFVAIGTGIAAAQVVDGVAFAGAHGAAGEIGHIVVRPDGPRCGCGQRGCLEAVASAAAVGRRYTELTGVPATAADVAGWAAAGVAGRAAADVAGRAGGGSDGDPGGGPGDEVAARVWRETVDALADGLLIGQALFDAETLVIGGGLAEAGDHLLDPLRAALRQRLTFHREPRLVPAALGDEAGRLGAALIALDTLEAP